MTYSRTELDWIEAEWAFHLHGRSAFLSREDFQQLMAWNQEGVPADLLVAAMEAYFLRRAQRPRPRSFVALKHLAPDVAKGMVARAALARAGAALDGGGDWHAVPEPLQSRPKAKALFEAWQRCKAKSPDPDNPGFLEAFDRERQALRAFLDEAAAALGPRLEELEADLRDRLSESGLEPESLVWRRAWEHHRARVVCQAWGLEP